MNEHLRTVTFAGGHKLETWDTGRCDRMGKSILRYELSTPDGAVVFGGEDFACSPMSAIDSDDCLRAVLGFLTLRRGDTDSEYFDRYTPAQLAWRDEHAEYAGCWALDEGDVSEPWETTDDE